MSPQIQLLESGDDMFDLLVGYARLQNNDHDRTFPKVVREVVGVFRFLKNQNSQNRREFSTPSPTTRPPTETKVIGSSSVTLQSVVIFLLDKATKNPYAQVT